MKNFIFIEQWRKCCATLANTLYTTWHIPFSPAAPDTKSSQHLCFTRATSWVCPGYSSLAPWQEKRVLTKKKKTFLKQPPRSGRPISSFFVCCSRWHSINTRDIHLRSFLHVAANVMTVRMVVVCKAQSLWRKGLPISWLIWTRIRTLEMTIVERQHRQYGDVPISGPLSTIESPSLELSVCELTSLRRYKPLCVLESVGIS